MENRNILHGIFAISGHLQEFAVAGPTGYEIAV